ncbi:hypothetical protein VKT23_012317 [Stygiomarasmius scandens]|uniref:Uncharacterized protein n=1 Tax=Marasmiellus scandens TaxID=2682957 RepID=A0ABR1J972_9AGAR
MHYTSNTCASTRPIYDRNQSYPLILYPSPTKNSSTKSSTSSITPSPGSVPQTVTHDISKPKPGYLSMAPSPTVPATSSLLAELTAESIHVHIHSLDELEATLVEQLHQPTSDWPWTRITYDKGLKDIVDHLDKQTFRRSLRLWIVSGYIFIKAMVSKAHEVCVQEFKKSLEDALRSMASVHNHHDHDLVSFGTTSYVDEDNEKQLDGCWCPLKQSDSEGPWIVLEVGYSQSTSSLKQNAEWWITHSDHIHLLILADIHTQKREAKTVVKSIDFRFLVPAPPADEDRAKDQIGTEGEDGDESKDEDENEFVAGPRTYITTQFISIPGEGPVTENLRLHASWIYGKNFSKGRPDWLPLSVGFFGIPASALERLRNFVVAGNARDTGDRTVLKRRSRPLPTDDIEYDLPVDQSQQLDITGWSRKVTRHKDTRRKDGRHKNGWRKDSRRKGNQRVQKDE